MELEASCFKFSDISFCDRRCDNITSMEFKGKIIKTLKENYNINVIQIFSEMLLTINI